MARVALEMQESPRHNFGQLPPRLLMESIRKSHLLRRSLACSRFLVSCKHDLSHRTFGHPVSEPSRLARIEEWLEEKRNLCRKTERLSLDTMG